MMMENKCKLLYMYHIHTSNHKKYTKKTNSANILLFNITKFYVALLGEWVVMSDGWSMKNLSLENSFEMSFNMRGFYKNICMKFLYFILEET